MGAIRKALKGHADDRNDSHDAHSLLFLLGHARNGD
jgi:hypothetical protein